MKKPTLQKQHFVVLCMALFMMVSTSISAQEKIFYPNVSSANEVDFLQNANDGDLNSHAVVRSSSGIAVEIGAYSGHLELNAGTTLPARTTTYLRLDTEDNLLEPLLGGSLGDLVSSLLGVLLFGNQEFTVEAKNQGVTVLQGDSQISGDFATDQLRVVVDKDNNFYLSITPDQPYESVRITNRMGSLIGLGATRTINIYEVFYLNESLSCGQPQFTSYDGSGITLELLNVGAGVQNPHLAIDDSEATFSELGLGTLGVAASIEQRIDFGSVTSQGELYAITISVDPSLLSLGLLNNLEFDLLLDGQVQETTNAATLLDLDLLTLLENGEAATLLLTPSTDTNGIVIRLSSLVGVSLDQNIRIHNISRLPKSPILDVSSENVAVCEGESVSLVATADPATNNPTLHWYDAAVDGNLLASVDSGESFVVGSVSNDISYFVSVTQEGCPEESVRAEAAIDVIAIPAASDITVSGNGETFCASTPIELNPDSDIEGSYQWYFDIDMNNEITSGLIQNGIEYTIDSDGGLTIVGLTEAQSPMTYYVNIIEESAGCTIASGALKPVTVSVSDTNYDVTVTTDFELNYNGIVSNLNPDNTVTLTGTVQGDVQSGDVMTFFIGNQSYSANVSPSLDFTVDIDLEELLLDSDGELNILVEGAVQGCSDAEIIIIDAPEVEVEQLLQIFCASDNPTIADLQVNGSNLVWFDSILGGAQLNLNTPLENGGRYYVSILGIPIGILPRIEVTVQFIDVPNVTTNSSIQVFCALDAPVIDDLQVEGETVVFYDSLVGGSVMANSELLVDGGTYFATNIVAGCEDTDRLTITVELVDPEPPTTINILQTFCASDDPTIVDIDVEGESILFFDAEVGGNLLDPNQVLVDGETYFAANVVLGCESAIRIEITVELIDVPPPTTNNQNQVFCGVDTPTVDDLQVNENDVVWYDAETGGNQLDGDEPLVDGMSYYAANREMGCESEERLQINVTLATDGPAVINGEFDEACLDDQEIYTTQTGMQNYSWTVMGGEIIEGGSSIDDFATVRWNTTENTAIAVSYDNEQCGTSSEQQMPVNVVSCVGSANFGIIVYNEFSPDGDGFNDTFRIDGIEDVTANVEVYNRYGRLVFSNGNYQNDWDGIANANGVFKKGEHLPSGTYYYVIVIPESNQKLSGWLQLAR